MSENKIYKKGEDVPEKGIYVCVPCGFKKDLDIGDKFSECTSCLATDNNKDGENDEEEKEYIESTGMWEKLVEEEGK